MNPVQAVQSVFRQYATFSGRAMRSEFWWFFLFTLVGAGATAVLDLYVLGIEYGDSGYGPTGVIFELLVIIPTLAVSARRLHDTGRSGWWQLLLLVPCLGMIVLLIWWCQDSGDDNQHGPHPRTPVTWGTED